MNEQQRKSLSEDEINAQIEYLSSAKCNHTYHKYVDITGDLVEGTLLSRILYWFTPDKKNNTKVRIFKDGKYWIAKQRKDWWEEIRISERQYDKAIKGLAEKGFVVLAKYKFNSMPTVHIRPEWDKINEAVEIWKENLRKEIIGENNQKLQKQENGNDTKCNSQWNDTKCNSGIAQTGIPLTCITNTDYNNKDYSSMDVCSFSGKKSAHPTQLDSFLEKAFADELVEPDEAEARISDLKEIITYFMAKYMQEFCKTHRKLTEPAVKKIVENYLFPDDDEYGTMNDMYTLEDYRQIIDLYFMTRYGDGTEKSLSHFMSGLIRRNLKVKLID